MPDLQAIASLFPLPGPVEIPAMPNGRPLSFRVTNWQEGTVTIHPRATGQAKVIRALRVWIERVDRPAHVAYYDLLPGQIIDAILPFLREPSTARSVFTITAWGYSVRRTWTIGVAP